MVGDGAAAKRSSVSEKGHSGEGMRVRTTLSGGEEEPDVWPGRQGGPLKAPNLH